jgi:hypothetical protein
MDHTIIESLEEGMMFSQFSKMFLFCFCFARDTEFKETFMPAKPWI